MAPKPLSAPAWERGVYGIGMATGIAINFEAEDHPI